MHLRSQFGPLAPVHEKRTTLRSCRPDLHTCIQITAVTHATSHAVEEMEKVGGDLSRSLLKGSFYAHPAVTSKSASAKREKEMTRAPTSAMHRGLDRRGAVGGICLAGPSPSLICPRSGFLCKKLPGRGRGRVRGRDRQGMLHMY